MGYVDTLRGTVVGLDTAPLIYFIEKNPEFHPKLRPFFVALAAGELVAVTSTITIVETLVHPIRKKHHDIAKRYHEILLGSPHVVTYDVSSNIAQKAAEIRAAHNLRTPDAIQLATALNGGATFFLTNDRALRGFSELEVLIVSDLVL